MIQKAKYALAFALGVLYILFWWGGIVAAGMDMDGVNNLHELCIWGITLGTIGILAFVMVAFIEHWDE